MRAHLLASGSEWVVASSGTLGPAAAWGDSAPSTNGCDGRPARGATMQEILEAFEVAPGPSSLLVVPFPRRDWRLLGRDHELGPPPGPP